MSRRAKPASDPLAGNGHVVPAGGRARAGIDPRQAAGTDRRRGTAEDSARG